MNTKTRIETTIVDQRHATSAILFGGESNRYYADERTRQIVTRVERNVHGEYVARAGTGRTVDFAGNATPELCGVETRYSSPVFTVIDDARDWACAAAHWMLAHYVSSVPAVAPAVAFPVANVSHTYCPTCGHYDTLQTALNAWSDDTTCTTPDCGFEHRRSIGD